MTDAKCKICRRAGEKLYLKGERCFTPKCAIARHSNIPGQHGNKRGRKRSLSEYGMELREKQKIRFLYGLTETQLENYVEKASRQKGVLADNLVKILESRLDNVVFRSGLAVSRSIARHMVTYGHITVDKKSVSIPSFSIYKEAVVGIRPESQGLGICADLSERLKKYTSPAWITLDKDAKTATVLSVPNREDAQLSQDLKLVVQYYSR